jgi:hypothetical protein
MRPGPPGHISCTGQWSSRFGLMPPLGVAGYEHGTWRTSRSSDQSGAVRATEGAPRARATSAGSGSARSAVAALDLAVSRSLLSATQPRSRSFRMAEQAKEQVDVIALARQSDDFRRVVITGDKIQIVVMTIQPGEEIGAETHEGHDQVLFFVDGEGEAVLDGVVHGGGRRPVLRPRWRAPQLHQHRGPSRCASSPLTHRRSTSPGRSTLTRPRPMPRRRALESGHWPALTDRR